MKNILYIVLAVSLITVSCKNRKAAEEKAKQETQIVEESKLPESVKENPEDVNPEERDLAPEDREIGVAVISISKSVCF